MNTQTNNTESSESQSKLTRQQQKALYLWLSLVADELRNRGLDMRKALIAPIIPTKESVLEMIWRPIMQAYVGKTSTTQLLKHKEIEEIVDIIKVMFMDMKSDIIMPPFPSDEEIANQQLYGKKI